MKQTWYIIHHKFVDCEDNLRDDSIWQFMLKENAEKVIEIMKNDSTYFSNELFIEEFEIGGK